MPEAPLALSRFSRYFPPTVPKVYIVSFCTHDDRRPSKFIVLADNMRSAIEMAWEKPDYFPLRTMGVLDLEV